MVPAAFAAALAGTRPDHAPTATASPATPTRRAPGPNRSTAMRCSRRRRRPCSATSARPARRSPLRRGRGGGALLPPRRRLHGRRAKGPTAGRSHQPRLRHPAAAAGAAAAAGRTPAGLHDRLGYHAQGLVLAAPDGPVAPGDNLHWSGRYQNWNLMCGEVPHHRLPQGLRRRARPLRHHLGRGRTWAARPATAPAARTPSARRVAAAGERAASAAAYPNRALAGARPGRPVRRLPRAPRPAGRGRSGRRAAVRPVRPRQPAPRPLSRRRPADSTRSSSTAPTARAACTRRAWPAPTATTPPRSPARRRQRAVPACHNPAPDRGRFPGLQAKDYDAPSHHFHRGGAGVVVDCHMPSRNYMVVHPRRDHAIRVPRPDLGARTGARRLHRLPCRARRR